MGEGVGRVWAYRRMAGGILVVMELFAFDKDSKRSEGKVLKMFTAATSGRL